MKFMKQLLLPWWPLKLTLFLVFIILLDLSIGLTPVSDPSRIIEADLTIQIVKDDKPNNTRFHVRADDVFTDRNGRTPLVNPGGATRIRELDGKKVRLRFFQQPPSLLFPGHDVAISIQQNDQWVLEERESTMHYQSVFVRWSIFAALVGACFFITLAIEFVAIRRSQSRI